MQPPFVTGAQLRTYGRAFLIRPDDWPEPHHHDDAGDPVWDLHVFMAWIGRAFGDEMRDSLLESFLLDEMDRYLREKAAREEPAQREAARKASLAKLKAMTAEERLTHIRDVAKLWDQVQASVKPKGDEIP